MSGISSTDLKKSIKAFLDSQPYYSPFSQLDAHFHSIKLRDDDFLRRQKDRMLKYLTDERENYLKLVSDLIEELQIGAKQKTVSRNLVIFGLLIAMPLASKYSLLPHFQP